MADDSKYYEPALRRASALFGEDYAKKVFDEYDSWDPDLSQLIQRFAYGGMYERTVLDQKTRQLITVAALTVQNALPQLESHSRAALRMGATKDEVLETIMQMAVYCGFPYALQAARRFLQIAHEETK
ncbi:MAG: carboxymuconolactone decarboxylase family protein [Chloroflexota bacterium]